MFVEINFTRKVEKQLIRVPRYIKESLYLWATTIKMIGILETRKISGYHDEPLLGKRVGQRSIRLSKAFRAIYIQEKINEVLIITVVEVNKHEY